MSSTNLTDNDRKILAAAWSCFETQPKINFDKLATIMGYKNSQTASACFQPVKKKLLAAAVAESGGTPAATPKKKAAAATPKSKGKGKGKRGRADSDAGDDAEDNEELFGAKLKKAKKAVAEEEGEEVEVKSEGGEAE